MEDKKLLEQIPIIQSYYTNRHHFTKIYDAVDRNINPEEMYEILFKNGFCHSEYQKLTEVAALRNNFKLVEFFLTDKRINNNSKLDRVVVLKILNENQGFLYNLILENFPFMIEHSKMLYKKLDTILPNKPEEKRKVNKI